MVRPFFRFVAILRVSDPEFLWANCDGDDDNGDDDGCDDHNGDS